MQLHRLKKEGKDADCFLFLLLCPLPSPVLVKSVVEPEYELRVYSNLRYGNPTGTSNSLVQVTEQ
jgi:hypothetical protein